MCGLHLALGMAACRLGRGVQVGAADRHRPPLGGLRCQVGGYLPEPTSGLCVPSRCCRWQVGVTLALTFLLSGPFRVSTDLVGLDSE